MYGRFIFRCLLSALTLGCIGWLLLGAVGAQAAVVPPPRWAPALTATPVATAAATETALSATATATVTGTGLTVTASTTALTTPNVTASVSATDSATSTVTITATAQATATVTVTPPCNGAWAVVPSPNQGTSKESNGFNGVAVVSAADVWAVGDADRQALIEHWDGSAWALVPVPDVAGATLNAVAVHTAHDVWAVGNRLDSTSGQPLTLIERWGGTAWAVVPSPSTSGRTSALTGVAVGSATDVWAVGYSADNGSTAQTTLILHWNGVAWTLVPSPNVVGLPSRLWSVTVIGAADVWAVGSAGDSATNTFITLTEHWNGMTWTIVPSPNITGQFSGLRSVAAAGPNDVWAVGGVQGNQVLEHWDGTAWSLVAPPAGAPGNLQAVAVAGPADVWAVGNRVDSFDPSLTEHWDGQIWTVVPASAPNGRSLTGVAVAGSGTVWAVGDFFAQERYQTLTLRYRCSAPTCTVQFSDVSDPTAYYYQGVYYLARRGVIVGYSDGTFRPFNQTTRGQMTKIVTLGFGIPLVNPPVAAARTFSDVLPANVFYGVIERAAARGIISGYTCGGVDPDRGRRTLRQRATALLPPRRQRDARPTDQNRGVGSGLDPREPADPDLHRRGED